MSAARPPGWVRALVDPLGPAAGTRRGLVAFGLLVLVATCWDLGGRSLHNLDLPRFGVIAHEMLAGGSWIVPTQYGEVYANKPPLYPWLVALVSAPLGGVSPLTVRLPSALGLVLLVVAAASWGRRRTGSLGAGRAAALLLLGTFLVLRLGRESRPDMLAAGLATAALALLDGLASGARSPRAAWGAGVLVGLTLLAKGPAALVLPALVLLLPAGAHRVRDRVRGARLPVVLGVAALVAGPWLVAATLHAGWGYAESLVLGQAATRLAGEGNKLEPLGYYALRFLDAGLPWTPLYLLALGLGLAPARVAPGTDRGAGRSLALAAILTLALFSLVPTKHVRYVVGVFPALALAVGALGLRAQGLPPRPGWPTALRALRVVSLLLAAVLVVAATQVPGALFPALLPAALLALLALPPALGRAPPEGSEARRVVAGGLLLLVVLSFAGYWILRDRYRERAGDHVQRVVAAGRDGRELWTLHPVVPDFVFTAAPDARYAPTAALLPAAAVPADVLLLPSDRRAVEARRGETGRVLATFPRGDEADGILLVRFGAE